RAGCRPQGGHVVAATRVVVDRALLWAMAATWAVSALAALAAAVGAWRAARTARRTLVRLEALRPSLVASARAAPAPAPDPAMTAPHRIEAREEMPGPG